ncbi:MAG: hypothetical protein JNJ60_16355 [Rhodocyclaceae bacterium]|nr:hypothetical protein [Rhodocyclaceae bacterium]
MTTATIPPGAKRAAWPSTLAEVTVMDSERMRPMCIEQEDIAGTHELARQKDKFRLKLLSLDTDRKSETSLLIEKMYSWRGYNMKSGLEQNPNRITLNAELNGRIYGTLTVNLDSPAGLSVDETYREEVNSLRSRGRKVCEFGKFAVEQAVRSKRLIATLMNLLLVYAHRLNGCDDALIEVNPRHTGFYEKYMGFARFGSERLCPRVNAPAVLLRLDFDYMDRQVELLGGRWRELPDEKSFYKYFFPPEQEAQIVARLRQNNAE